MLGSSKVRGSGARECLRDSCDAAEESEAAALMEMVLIGDIEVGRARGSK